MSHEVDTVTDHVLHVDRSGAARIDEIGTIVSTNGSTSASLHRVTLAHQLVVINARGEVDLRRGTTPLILGGLVLGTLPTYPVRVGSTWTTKTGNGVIQHTLTGSDVQLGHRVAIIRSTVHHTMADNTGSTSHRSIVDETEVARFDVTGGRVLSSDITATFDVQVRVGTVTAVHVRSMDTIRIRLVPPARSRRHTTKAPRKPYVR